MERSWKAEPSEADTWQLPRCPKSTGGAKYKYLKGVIFGTTKLKYPGLSVISDKWGESSVLFVWAQCHLMSPSSSAQQQQPHLGFCLKCNFKPHLKSTESESLGWWLRICFLTLSLDYLWWRARIKKFFLINKFIFIFINFSLTRSFVKCTIQGDKSSNRSLGGCYKSFKHLHSTCFPFLLKTGKKVHGLTPVHRPHSSPRRRHVHWPSPSRMTPSLPGTHGSLSESTTEPPRE